VATSGDASRFEIFGSAGALTITGGRFARYIRYDKDLIDFARTFAGPSPYGTPKAQEQPLPEADAFDPSATHKRLAEAILKKDPSLLLCPAEQGLWSLEVINGVYLSHHLGRKIKFPLSASRYDKVLQTLIARTPMPDRPTQKAVTGVSAATNEKQQDANLKKE
jgi:predicted dehydrogenase